MADQVTHMPSRPHGRPAPTPRAPHAKQPRPGLGCALIALAVTLAANSLLGPLAGGVIRYRYTPTMINQGIGLDAVALLIAAPLAVAAAVLALRGRPAALVLGCIPAAFAAYMAPQYMIGPDYLHLPGNNERFVPLHLGLFILGLAVLAMCWRGLGDVAARAASPRGDRIRVVVLLGTAAFIGLGRWASPLADAMSGHPTGSAYLDNPTAFWLIVLLDVGVIVPAMIAAGLGLRLGARWARTAACVLFAWMALVPASVAAMAVAMYVREDPQGTLANMVVMLGLALVLTPCALALLRPVLSVAADGGDADGRG
jgi:hypothetical protein